MDQDHTPNHKPNRKSDIRISSQDVAVQLLARLDEKAYSEAIDMDAKCINENYLMPLSFPWRQGARLPNKARKALPRDIDDLHAVRNQTFSFNGSSWHVLLTLLLFIPRQLIVMTTSRLRLGTSMVHLAKADLKMDNLEVTTVFDCRPWKLAHCL